MDAGMTIRLILAVLTFSAVARAQHRVLVSGCGYGEVAVIAADGTVEWSHPEKNETNDAWLLPNGDIAMGFKYGARIVRPDWEGKTGWKVIRERMTAKGGENHSCQPLPGGGFLIGESFDGVSRIIELDADFNETKCIELKGLGGRHSTFRQIRKTPQGTYLITQQQKGGIAMEVNAAGEIIRRFPDGRFGALRLENGNTLIACGDRGRIIEVDPAGTVVWALEKDDLEGITLAFTAGMQRLPNGNTLFCNWGGHSKTRGASLIEVTPDKRVVWSASPGKANRISHVKVLPAK